jgi:hypothetical protein
MGQFIGTYKPDGYNTEEELDHMSLFPFNRETKREAQCQCQCECCVIRGEMEETQMHKDDLSRAELWLRTKGQYKAGEKAGQPATTFEEGKVSAKLKGRLKARGKTKDGDLPCFHVAEDWMDPPLDSKCWIFSPTYKWVAKGRIVAKKEGDSDTLSTWRIKVLHVEEGTHGYMAGAMEICVRSQIQPTMRRAYSALHSRLQCKIIEHGQQVEKLNKRIKEIMRFV